MKHGEETLTIYTRLTLLRSRNPGWPWTTKHLFTNFTTYCHVWLLSRQVGTRAESRIYYEHLSFENRFMNNPICSHGSITHRTEDGPSLYGWLLCDLDCRCRYSRLNYSGIIWLFSVNRTNGNYYSYRSLANQSFESSPDSLTVHSTRLQTLSNFPDHQSLTSIDMSRYFSDTF